MIGLLQRVRQAQVEVGQRLVSRIDTGLLVLIGVEKNDSEAQCRRMSERLLHYRVFNDPAGTMNHSLLDIQGELLLVPQFTLAAETDRGNRASFSKAAPPDEGKRLFDHLAHLTKQSGLRVETGEFGADMRVSLVNEGPVTFYLRVS